MGAVASPVIGSITQKAIDKFGPGQYTVEVNGKKVTLDNKIFDANRIDKNTGLTNRQLMEKGLAPYGNDGQKINIHHIDQTNKGPVIEMTNTKHTSNYSNLHQNTGQNPSQINRSEFNSWRNGYWNWRSNNVNYAPEKLTNIGGIISNMFNNTFDRSIVSVPNK